MNRRDFLKACGITVVAQVSIFAKSVKKPNILFVFADQLRSMELGCYGGRQVKTPNIDSLASQGVLFTHAYSTYPVCSPFRAMLMTGNFPMKNGMVMNDHFLRNPSPYFAQICKSAGYDTGYIGKWHIDGHGRSSYIPSQRRLGFDFWRTLECTHSYFDSKYFHQDEKMHRIWKGYDAVAQTDEACDYIKSTKKESPFCLFMSWGPPHDPYIAPKKYMDRFDSDEIHLRGNVDDFASAQDMRDQCDTAVPDNFMKIRKSFLPKLTDHENKEIKKWYRGYFAAIETLDDCIGKLLKTLEDKGVLDDTIVVFTSDHGDNLGSHRQYGKQLPYEESISIPFIIRYPMKISKGVKTDALLSPVDMMPTLLSLADIPCSEVDGRDISAAAVGKDADVQDAVLIMRHIWLGTNWITNGSGPWRGVRTKRYTYARKSDTKKPWMLFDNETDPLQLNNLVENPEYSELVKQLDRKTGELLKAAGDPEDPIKIAKQIQAECHKNGVPDRANVLFPPKIDPGSGFKF